MRKLLVFVVVVAALGFAGTQGYSWYNHQVYGAPTSLSEPVAFHVAQGETVDQIGANLADKGLIQNQQVFQLYVRSSGSGARIEAGDFSLNRDMSMAKIVERLTLGKAATTTVQLLEGMSLTQMATIVQASGLATAPEYTAAAKPEPYSGQFAFLASRPAGAPDNLEGFLFPDTYQVQPSQGAAALVQRQLQRFDQQLTQALRAALAQPTPARPAESIWNAVVLASIVEREVNRDPDRGIVCGIFYNRLAAGITLGSDVTVLYGDGLVKGPLTQQQIDDPANPYNTRIHPGLPPGPISNPGLASLNACTNPQKTDYLFFFADAQGTTRYARTDAEFQQEIQRYGVRPA